MTLHASQSASVSLPVKHVRMVNAYERAASVSGRFKRMMVERVCLGCPDNAGMSGWCECLRVMQA